MTQDKKLRMFVEPDWKITNEAYAAFREANDWYELNNSDAL